MATALTGGELVVLDRDYEYLTLNESASRVWELLNEPRQFDDLVAALTEEYQISREVCLDGLSPILDTLVERGCISLSAPANLTWGG